MSTPQSQKKLRLVDDVSVQLTRMISGGILKPGDQLPSEQSLADKFEVSKPVVREALRNLVTMGLVKSGRGKLAEVQAIGPKPLNQYFRLVIQATPKGLVETVQLRRALEEYIVQIVAQRITRPELSQLKFALGVMWAASELEDEWIEADLRFHTQIVELAENVLLKNLFFAAHDAIAETIRVVSKNHRDFEKQASMLRHEAIFKAIEAGDALAARRAMSAHFDPVESIARRVEARTLAEDGATTAEPVE